MIAASDKLRPLTSREIDVLDCVAAGLTNAKTAEKFGISPRTVEVHRSKIMAKLQLRSAVELAEAAARYRVTGVVLANAVLAPPSSSAGLIKDITDAANALAVLARKDKAANVELRMLRNIAVHAAEQAAARSR